MGSTCWCQCNGTRSKSDLCGRRVYARHHIGFHGNGE
ncbi:Uncharacterised protein [Vibrio cholerae]|nr:Uncharacterised protein [Vibrio cholerae]